LASCVPPDLEPDIHGKIVSGWRKALLIEEREREKETVKSSIVTLLSISDSWCDRHLNLG
jgi:hypothetical protein